MDSPRTPEIAATAQASPQAQIKTLYDVGLGQTTSDGRLTVLPIACLGQCERAPALMIDQDVYGDVTPEKIEQIVEKYK